MTRDAWGIDLKDIMAQDRQPLKPTVRVTLEPGAQMPILAEGGSAGYDLAIPGDPAQPSGGIFFPYGQLVVVDTGVRIESPFPMMLKLRSSLTKRGFIMPDWGLIDPSYRGPLKVPLIYLATEYRFQADRLSARQTLNFGERFAQLVFFRAELPTVEVVEMLSETERGEGGFGSTGQ